MSYLEHTPCMKPMIYYLRILLFELKCFFINLFNCPEVFLNRNIICRHSILRNVKFRVAKGCRVFIENAILRDCRILMLSEGCELTIKKGGRIRNAQLYCEDENSQIVINEGFTMGGGEIASTEGRSVTIMEDCMFSEDIEIRNGDSHSIVPIDNQLSKINRGKDVLIGNHVWLAAHVRIMKGSEIPGDCVIANSSIVSGSLTEGNAVYGGNPARLLKTGISWNRKRNL